MKCSVFTTFSSIENNSLVMLRGYRQRDRSKRKPGPMAATETDPNQLRAVVH